MNIWISGTDLGHFLPSNLILCCTSTFLLLMALFTETKVIVDIILMSDYLSYFIHNSLLIP